MHLHCEFVQNDIQIQKLTIHNALKSFFKMNVKWQKWVLNEVKLFLGVRMNEKLTLKHEKTQQMHLMV